MAATDARLTIGRAGLGSIEKILTLQDRNPHSPTYGCFDRTYWQYRMLDFPSGIAQECVYPLALAYSLDIPGSAWFQQTALRTWAIAGMHYATSSAHNDGSCDDFFPYERAGGAAAFALMACAESYKILQPTAAEGSAELLAGFEKRANWLAHLHESGRLTNHQALIVHCLRLCGELLNTDRWQSAIEERLQRVIEWQSTEGWFDEYGGFDPGYHSLTYALLADYWVNGGRDDLADVMQSATEAMRHFPLPDGSPAGEIGSRNTLNYFPHGFELAGKRLPAVLAMNDRFAAAVEQGLAPCYDDDHAVSHHCWSYLLTWRDWCSDRPVAEPLSAEERVWLPKAGLLIDRRNDQTLYVALNKGGVYKHFAGEQQTRADTQLSVVTDNGTAVAHLLDDYDVTVEADRILVRGTMGWAKQTRMSPVKMIVLRVIMLCGGRFFPNLIRSLLQKVLITGKKAAPFRFQREFSWTAETGQWRVADELTADSWGDARQVGIDAAQTSISVIMSRVFQRGQLQAAEDFTGQLAALKDGDTLAVEHTLQ